MIISTKSFIIIIFFYQIKMKILKEILNFHVMINIKIYEPINDFILL